MPSMGSVVGHHRGEYDLDVLDGLGQGGICRDKAVNGGVLLDGRVGKVVRLFDPVAWLAPKVLSPIVMWEMSSISAIAAVQ